MLLSNRAWFFLAAVLGLTGIVHAQNSFTVTGPSVIDASNGAPTNPLPSASFDVSSNPSNQFFEAAVPNSGPDAFVTIAASADQCTLPGATSVSSSTPVMLFACVNTTGLVRGNYASLITITSFGSTSIPSIRVPVQASISPVGEIKTTPASPISLSSTSLNQAIAVQFVANNGASGGSSGSACSDSSAGNGSGSSSACIASITADPAGPEGQWMTLSNNCPGVVLVGNTTCTIQVTAEPTKLTSAAVVGTTYVGHIIIVSTHGDRADVLVNFTYSQAAGPALTITSGTSFSGTAGQAFQATLTASGGTAPYTWSVTGLPSTLTLNQSTGVISGTPSQGSYPVMVSVQDSVSSTAGPQKVTINIQASQTTVTQMFPHITDGYDGSVWQSDFLLFNTNSAAVTVQLVFHLDNGVKGLSVIQPNGSNSSVAGISGIVIQPFGTAFYRTSGLAATNPVVTGWVEIDSTLPIQGQVVFRRNTAPTSSIGNYYEVSVPLVAPAMTFTFPFDSTTYTPASAPILTALAIANPSDVQATLNCTAYNISGSALGATVQVASLAASTHTQEVLQLTAPLDTQIQQGRGLITCTSSAPMGILGLRAFGAHALSELPIIYGN
ncbi:MAG TPA: Ig domain-containing protein [Bryobacteraceae bacterium]|nr:Ig domain-containing protein [Bryobacteraceae bacterium]